MKKILIILIGCFMLNAGYHQIEKFIFEYQMTTINQQEVERCSKSMQLNPELVCD
jgi:hypothetical protein